MDKITQAANVTAYGASTGSFGFWFYKLTTSMTPDQWAAIGVIGSLMFAGLTCVSNAVIKVWAIKRGYKIPSDEG
ncbi:phage holin [Pantoea stewartii]|uniref:Lysis protein S n=1 Tax=Pantoea stewartii subsp. stewartii DC283 TaxID=660596 RepID=H3RLK4_PANSE|nr:phage holin [Pantoea stewartii]ARF52762.1 peptidoglycan-binding protein LysM [Pantoea stewartii subsp. stewartii DC283]EHT97717.1 lysis protein S [Pantoea stewartii subsp. stewartii DC283]KAB0554004.1 peptidoglycan-binding protein LysM [Pantoea stewartii subsp. stewartii]